MNTTYFTGTIDELTFRLYTNSWVVGRLKDDITVTLGIPQTSEEFQEKQDVINQLTAWAETEATFFGLLWAALLTSFWSLGSDSELSQVLEEFETSLSRLDEELVRLESILTNLRISLAADKCLTRDTEYTLSSFSREIDEARLLLQGINLKFGQKEKNDTTPEK